MSSSEHWLEKFERSARRVAAGQVLAPQIVAMLEAEGVDELLPGAYALVAWSIGETHVDIVPLLSKSVRNASHELLMPEGIKELEFEDCAKTAVDNREITARDLNMVVFRERGPQGKRV